MLIVLHGQLSCMACPSLYALTGCWRAHKQPKIVVSFRRLCAAQHLLCAKPAE
jgi:hypothetical protein